MSLGKILSLANQRERLYLDGMNGGAEVGGLDWIGWSRMDLEFVHACKLA
jgi:hypothetical protein